MAGYDANVIFLWHCDGSDGDQGNQTATTGQTVTTIGTSQIDVDQKKFGTGSFLLDGDSDYGTVPDANYVETDAFTVDFWFRMAVDQTCGFFGQNKLTANYDAWGIYFETSANRLYFMTYTSAGAYGITFHCPFTPSIDTWYHIAVVRIDKANASTSWRLFIDGVSQTLTKQYGNWSDSIPAVANTLTIGYAGIADVYCDGWLEEIRISNVARWTSDFTPPTEAYSADTGASNVFLRPGKMWW